MDSQRQHSGTETRAVEDPVSSLNMDTLLAEGGPGTAKGEVRGGMLS